MSMKVKVWKRPLVKQGIMYKLVITTKKNKIRTSLNKRMLVQNPYVVHAHVKPSCECIM
jgi:hypothetical protein